MAVIALQFIFEANQNKLCLNMTKQYLKRNESLQHIAELFWKDHC